MTDTRTTLVLSGAPPLVDASHCPLHSTTRSIPAAFAPESTAAEAASRFVALSKFVVANGKAAEVKQAFRDRPHMVDGQPGFVRMEVFSPLDRPEEIWLITYWIDSASFKLWHHTHLYHQSHKGIPKGLKLVPGETKIRHFERICS
ncbi:MAG: antibiotic biosynthesis monooxygenase [Verrucomicrobiota bacterium]|jgi:heme-degrading monooxygenase HmoA